MSTRATFIQVNQADDQAYDLIVEQRQQGNGNYAKIRVRPIAGALFGFDADKNPAMFSAGEFMVGANGQTIVGNSNGSWTVTANGTDQSIVFSPSGTGSVKIPVNSTTAGLWIGGNAGDALRIGATSGGAVINFNGSQPISFQVSGTPTIRIALSGNLLLGGLTTDSGNNNVLQMNAGAALMAVSTTSYPSLRIPSGVAPTSPADGDLWYDGTNIKFRVGGSTKTFTLT